MAGVEKLAFLFPNAKEEDILLSWGSSCNIYGLEGGKRVLKRVAEPDDDDSLEAQDIEIQIYERLGTHPDIIGYHGRSSDPDHDGIILEFAFYLSIFDFLREFALPPVHLRFKWCTQVANAMSFVHSKGIVHCDLTYRNVLLTEEFDAKLSDFGGCSIDGSLPLGWFGPPFYLPRGQDDPPNAKNDIFAFGSLVFTIMVGEEPYEGLSMEELNELYVGSAKLPPVPDHVDHRLRQVILRCWDYAYDSMDTVGTELKHIATELLLRPLLGHSDKDDAWTLHTLTIEEGYGRLGARKLTKV